MKLYKNFIKTLAAGLSAVLLLSACGSSTSTSTSNAGTSDSNVLRVGMECAYAPFNWTQSTDANGAVAIGDGSYAGGYDVEIAKLIADSLGKELVIVKTEWDGLVPSLTSGKVDAIIAGMSATEERKVTIDFTNDYYTSDLVVVVKADGPYANATSLADLSGAKITGQLNTLHYDVIDQIPNVQKQAALESFPTMIAALTAGKIDGYISERPGALSAVASNPSLTFIEFPAGEGFDFSGDEVSIAVGVKKGSPLTAEINAALANISDEKRAELMQQAVANQPLSN